MEEAELVEIESRIGDYPQQAQQDILRLTRALRLARGPGRQGAATRGSPLHDAPTGLLNSGAYGVRFAAARARATRFRKIFAVMSVDVGVFARLAEAERAEAARDVAERLQRCLRATDTLARVNDGAFAIILEDLTQPDHAERVKQNVQAALAAPVRAGSRELALEAQVRLQFYPDVQSGPITYHS